MADPKKKPGFRRNLDASKIAEFVSGGDDGGPSVVDRAGKQKDAPAPKPSAPSPQTTPPPRIHTPKPPPAYPWEADAVRADVTQTYNLRLPEPVYLKLKYIADYSPRSMQQICHDILIPGIERELKKLLKPD